MAFNAANKGKTKTHFGGPFISGDFCSETMAASNINQRKDATPTPLQIIPEEASYEHSIPPKPHLIRPISHQ
jgi:hypothetical protein